MSCSRLTVTLLKSEKLKPVGRQLETLSYSNKDYQKDNNDHFNLRGKADTIRAVFES